MTEPATPSEFYAALSDRLLNDNNPSVKIGGVFVQKQVVQEAMDEIMGVMVSAYMKQKEPTACQKIIGMLLVNTLEE